MGRDGEPHMMPLAVALIGSIPAVVAGRLLFTKGDDFVGGLSDAESEEVLTMFSAETNLRVFEGSRFLLASATACFARLTSLAVSRLRVERPSTRSKPFPASPGSSADRHHRPRREYGDLPR